MKQAYLILLLCIVMCGPAIAGPLEENFSNCLNGYSYSCNKSLLSEDEQSQVAKSDHQRNLSNCLNGYSYSCSKGLLSEDEQGQVARSDHQRNLSNCLNGYSYSCSKGLLSEDEQSQVAKSVSENKERATILCAENGSCYGDASANTGRPKTVNVRGYYRKDGTYVRGHYRSKPRRY